MTELLLHGGMRETIAQMTFGVVEPPTELKNISLSEA
jgi:hypothetical protein